MKKLLLAASMAALLGAGSAGAATLTFEGQANTQYSSTITRSGVDIVNVAGDIQHFHELDSTAFPAELPSNGTGVLFNDRPSRLQFTLNGGGVFNLGNFDTAALRAAGNQYGGATNLLVTSFLAGNQVAQLSYAINSNTYSTYSGTGLGSFDRLVFQGVGGGEGFILDNVNVNLGPLTGGVPEPASWALMLAGFGGIGFAMRRKAAMTRVAA